MTETPANEAIALLIDLAQRGEINPWDVQVIEVIDRYLSELALGNEVQPGQRDADLSQSGQAFFVGFNACVTQGGYVGTPRGARSGRNY